MSTGYVSERDQVVDGGRGVRFSHWGEFEVACLAIAPRLSDPICQSAFEYGVRYVTQHLRLCFPEAAVCQAAGRSGPPDPEPLAGPVRQLALVLRDILLHGKDPVVRAHAMEVLDGLLGPDEGRDLDF